MVNSHKTDFGVLLHPDSNLVSQVGPLVSSMSQAVQDALERAAKRSQRRSELETARLIVERNVGHDLADGEYGWLSVLPMPYLGMADDFETQTD